MNMLFRIRLSGGCGPGGGCHVAWLGAAGCPRVPLFWPFCGLEKRTSHTKIGQLCILCDVQWWFDTYKFGRGPFVVNGAVAGAALFADSLRLVYAIVALAKVSICKRGSAGQSSYAVAALPAAFGHSALEMMR